MDAIATKSVTATEGIAQTVQALDLLRDRMSAIAGNMAGIVSSVIDLKREASTFTGSETQRIQVSGEGASPLVVNMTVTMSAKNIADGLSQQGFLRFNGR